MDYFIKVKNFISRFLQSNVLLYCVVLLLVLKVGTIFISINLPQNIFFADVTETTLENFANQTRQAIGLAPLVENQKLNQAAEAKAENMVQNQYFSHTSPTGITPWFWFLQAGYKYKYAGENLAIGFYESEEVYQAWLNSPSHKANILNPNYTEVGTAVVKGFGPNDSVVVVQEFASPAPIKTAAVKKTNVKPVVTQPQPKPINIPATKIEPATNNNERVLSQTTEAQNFLEPSSGETKSDLQSRLMNYVLFEYDKLLQNIIYGVSSIIIGILLAFILFNFNANFNKELVFRSVLIVVLLSLATALNTGLVISIIPHQVII